MKVILFTGAYERTLDDKNRIQIPAPFRNVLDPERSGGVFFIAPGERDNTLSLYPESNFQELVSWRGTHEVLDQEAFDAEQAFFSLAVRVEMDKQGRIVLPERQLARVHLGTEVTITGAQDHLDLWRTSEYEQFIEEIGSRRSVFKNFLRRGARDPGGEGNQT